jgi:hypothetical protein
LVGSIEMLLRLSRINRRLYGITARKPPYKGLETFRL